MKENDNEYGPVIQIKRSDAAVVFSKVTLYRVEMRYVRGLKFSVDHTDYLSFFNFRNKHLQLQGSVGTYPYSTFYSRNVVEVL